MNTRDGVQELRELVERWMKEFHHLSSTGYGGVGERMGNVFRLCADELAALLAKAEAPASQRLSEACGVIGYNCPEFGDGAKTCELPKGHAGYHQQGSVRWLGYFGAPSAGSEAKPLRDAIETALWDNATGKDYYAAPLSIRREFLDVAMPLVADALTSATRKDVKAGLEEAAHLVEHYLDEGGSVFSLANVAEAIRALDPEVVVQRVEKGETK